MKKFLMIILMTLFTLLPAVAYADNAPDFEKRNAYIFYEVPDQILMCQNKKEDMVKGAKEFEETIAEHYDNRFNIIGIERVKIIREANGKKFNENQKREMIAKANNGVPLILKLELMGNGTATDTYQNLFGAKRSITVQTTKIKYTEYFGLKNENMFLEFTYGTFDYRPNTFAMGGQLWTKNMDARVLTKNCVKWIIRDMNKFNAPNKYTHPDRYENYMNIYTGNLEAMEKANSKVISTASTEN